MICKKCGEPLEPGAVFCGECGTKVDVEQQQVNENTSQPDTQPVSPPDIPTNVQPNVQPNAQYSTGQGTPVVPPFSGAPVAINAKQESGNKKVLIIGIVVAVIVIAIVAVFAVMTTLNSDDSSSDGSTGSLGGLGFGTASSIDQYMPSCVGWTYDDVEEYFRLIDCNVSYEYVYNSAYSENSVINQSIEPGEQIVPGCELLFVISKGSSECPEEYMQKIVVTGSHGSSHARMELYLWEQGEWIIQYGCNATVGRNGIGYNYGEGKGITPAGEFKLGVVLSEYAISNNGWPYQIVDENTCIVDDTSSYYYNTITDINSLPDGVGYDPIGRTIVYEYTDKCMYIEHNGNGIDSYNVIPGKGSAITICGRTTGLAPTAGCIDISESDFNEILSRLEYNLSPHIIIQVN